MNNLNILGCNKKNLSMVDNNWIEDIPKKLGEIESAGGKTIKDKTVVSPDFGFYGLFADPSDNIMGLWSKT
jgi:predicted enzyme related to lactoylglutathione lyase